MQILFSQNLHEIYEFVLMVGSLEGKYQNYTGLSEDERIYLREIVHQVLGRKTEIMEYLELAVLCRQGEQIEEASLF